MQDENIVEIAPGIYYQWLADCQIISFKMTNNDKEAVDAYINANLVILNSWPKDRPYLSLQEGDMNFLMTRYLQQKSMALVEIINERGLKGRLAAVTPSTIVAYVLMLVVRALFPLSMKKVKPCIFMNREEAIAWLKEAL